MGQSIMASCSSCGFSGGFSDNAVELSDKDSKAKYHIPGINKEGKWVIAAFDSDESKDITFYFNRKLYRNIGVFDPNDTEKLRNGKKISSLEYFDNLMKYDFHYIEVGSWYFKRKDNYCPNCKKFKLEFRVWAHYD